MHSAPTTRPLPPATWYATSKELVCAVSDKDANGRREQIPSPQLLNSRRKITFSFQCAGLRKVPWLPIRTTAETWAPDRRYMRSLRYHSLIFVAASPRMISELHGRLPRPLAEHDSSSLEASGLALWPRATHKRAARRGSPRPLMTRGPLLPRARHGATPRRGQIAIGRAARPLAYDDRGVSAIKLPRGIVTQSPAPHKDARRSAFTRLRAG